jgi:hypothetical protein
MPDVAVIGPEQGQGRAARSAARRSEPLTLCRTNTLGHGRRPGMPGDGHADPGDDVRVHSNDRCFDARKPQ